MPSGPQTYIGAVHVHTGQSGGDDTLDHVLEAAHDAQIDFVIITDHHSRRIGQENLEGWHDKVLVLCGEEVSTKEGHFLAFETRETIGERPTLNEALDETRRQYGQAVAVHHQLFDGRSPGIAQIPHPLDLRRADLLEIWSLTDEFLSIAPSEEVIQLLSRPERVVRGPSRRLLWQWDRQLEKRPLPIIGGLNVHQRKSPLLEWRQIFPYELAFSTICTCVQTPELPAVSLRARDLVWNALREGRSYIVNRSIERESPFLFEYHPPAGRVRPMGDDVPYAPKGRFHMRVPVEAEIVLRHNGQPLFWGTGEEMAFPEAGPGSYRVEAYLNRRLYILSNPIRLVDEEGVLQPTVSDVT